MPMGWMFTRKLRPSIRQETAEVTRATQKQELEWEGSYKRAVTMPCNQYPSPGQATTAIPSTVNPRDGTGCIPEPRRFWPEP